DDVEVLTGRCSVGQIGIQYHDAIVSFSQAQFIFCTDHSLGSFSPDLCLFDGEGLSVMRVKGSAYQGDSHLLARSDVRSAADDGQDFIPHIHSSPAQFVGIRMGLTCEYLTDYHTLQATW